MPLKLVMVDVCFRENAAAHLPAEMGRKAAVKRGRRLGVDGIVFRQAWRGTWKRELLQPGRDVHTRRTGTRRQRLLRRYCLVHIRARCPVFVGGDILTSDTYRKE